MGLKNSSKTKLRDPGDLKHGIEQIQEFVAAWAMKKYKNNRSKVSRIALGSVTPFCGIVAKLGQLERSTDRQQQIEVVGDILLFLCDYAAREDILLSHIPVASGSPTNKPNRGLVAVGRMSESLLRYHRKQKTFHEYRVETTEAIFELLGYLDDYVERVIGGIDLLSVLKFAVARHIRRRRKT